MQLVITAQPNGYALFFVDENGYRYDSIHLTMNAAAHRAQEIANEMHARLVPTHFRLEEQ
jgi:hypothetical protein